MAVTQLELNARYAGAVSAEVSSLFYAEHVPAALASLGLFRGHGGGLGRLIVFADDFEQAFKSLFPADALILVDDPSVSSFEAAGAYLAPGRDADGSDGIDAGRAARPRDIWFVNSIGGRGLRVPDLRALASAAHGHGALLAVDNTVASAFGGDPLSLGCDLCLEALDRVACGRLSAKAVAVSATRRFLHHLGAEAGAAEGAGADLLGRTSLASEGGTLSQGDIDAVWGGLSSLGYRMQAHFDHARALSEYLSCFDGMGRVSYPGLAGHPDHETAARTLIHGYGPAVDFQLPEGVAAGEFVSRCRLNGRGEPAGGPTTRLSARDGAQSRAIRLFAGTDDPLAIADDLDQALRWFCNPPEP
mgnify:CR=1 FL=1